MEACSESVGGIFVPVKWGTGELRGALVCNHLQVVPVMGMCCICGVASRSRVSKVRLAACVHVLTLENERKKLQLAPGSFCDPACVVFKVIAERMLAGEFKNFLPKLRNV